MLSKPMGPEDQRPEAVAEASRGFTGEARRCRWWRPVIYVISGVAPVTTKEGSISMDIKDSWSHSAHLIFCPCSIYFVYVLSHFIVFFVSKMSAQLNIS